MRPRTRGFVAASAAGVLFAATSVAAFEIGNNIGKSSEQRVCTEAWQNPHEIGRIILNSKQANEFESGTSLDVEKSLGKLLGGRNVKIVTVTGVGRPDSSNAEAASSGNSINLGVYSTAQSLADDISQLYRTNNVSSSITYHGSGAPGSFEIDAYTPQGCATS